MFAELIRAGLQALIEAEATGRSVQAATSAPNGRIIYHNGHRPKTVSTTAGDISADP